MTLNELRSLGAAVMFLKNERSMINSRSVNKFGHENHHVLNILWPTDKVQVIDMEKENDGVYSIKP